jgi:hypothetical protein
MYRPDGLSAGE